MSRLSPLPILFALTVSAIAPGGAHAANQNKQAQSELKAASKSRLSTLKKALSQRSAVLEAELGTFQAQFPMIAGGSDTPVEDLIVVIREFLDGVISDRSTAIDLFAFDAEQALGSAVLGGPDGPTYPKGFGVGDGGTVDQTRAKIEAMVGDTLADARKLIAKSAKKLRDKTGHFFQVTLGAPPARDAVPIPSSFIVSGSGTLTFDLFASFNRAGLVADGRLWLSGRVTNADTISLILSGPTILTTTFTPGPPRWSFETAVFTSYAEGNYLATVEQGAGGYAVLSVGMP